MIDLVVPMKKFLDTQKEVDPSNWNIITIDLKQVDWIDQDQQ
jgi:hypothetical protein